LHDQYITVSTGGGFESTQCRRFILFSKNIVTICVYYLSKDGSYNVMRPAPVITADTTQLAM
jgi:hypothetical protein